MTNLHRNHRIIAETLREPAGSQEVEITYKGIELIVRGDYQKGEHSWFNPHEGIGNPGCDEDFEVHEVYLVDSAIDIIDLFDMRDLAGSVLEHLHDDAEVCETT